MWPLILILSLQLAIPASRPTFVTWIDSGFDTGVEGLFDSQDGMRSRTAELLDRTEYHAFEFSDVQTSSDGRQLRFWSYGYDDVVVLTPNRDYRITRSDGRSIVLNSDGESVATIRGAHGKGVFERNDGVSVVYDGSQWLDGSVSYMIRESGGHCGSTVFNIYSTADPTRTLMTLKSHDMVEFVKRFDNTLCVCGRTCGDDPTGVWIERFLIDGTRLKRIDYREIPCPQVFGAVFSFVRDIDAEGRLVVAVEKRAPFVTPRSYFVIDAIRGVPQPLKVNYRGYVFFLDRNAIRQIAQRLDRGTVSTTKPVSADEANDDAGK